MIVAMRAAVPYRREFIMSSINSVGGNSPLQPIVSKTLNKAQGPDTSTPSTPTRAADRLELSGMSSLFSTLKTQGIRNDKVATIKSQIEAGTYDEDSKLDASLDKLMDDLQR